MLLLVGGSALFINLQGTLNSAWNMKRRTHGIIRSLVRARLVAFLMIFATGIGHSKTLHGEEAR